MPSEQTAVPASLARVIEEAAAEWRLHADHPGEMTRAHRDARLVGCLGAILAAAGHDITGDD